MVPIGSERSAARRGEADRGAERVALGLLGDLVGHDERELLARDRARCSSAGELGVWLVGEQGALLVRPRRRGGSIAGACGSRDADELPAGDRVAHLLLALREDELGFAKVANLGFSGATWRVRRRMRRALARGAGARRGAAARRAR